MAKTREEKKLGQCLSDSNRWRAAGFNDSEQHLPIFSILSIRMLRQTTLTSLDSPARDNVTWETESFVITTIDIFH